MIAIRRKVFLLGVVALVIGLPLLFLAWQSTGPEGGRGPAPAVGAAWPEPPAQPSGAPGPLNGGGPGGAGDPDAGGEGLLDPDGGDADMVYRAREQLPAAPSVSRGAEAARPAGPPPGDISSAQATAPGAAAQGTGAVQPDPPADTVQGGAGPPPPQVQPPDPVPTPSREEPRAAPPPQPQPAPSTQQRALPPPPAAGITAAQAAQPVGPEELPVYRVQPGDTLSRIAARFGTTAQALAQTNRLPNDILMPGQPLCIPPGKAAVSVQGPYGTKKAGHGELLTWSWARWVFPVGGTATVTDLQTGRKFRVYHMGGSNHADCEPLTAADTAIMYELYGRKWSWATRPVLLTVGGRTFAASINGQPHGHQTIRNNNFDGQFCLYFYDSKGHSSNAVNPRHQADVLRAAGW